LGTVTLQFHENEDHVGGCICEVEFDVLFDAELPPAPAACKQLSGNTAIRAASKDAMQASMLTK